MSITVLRIGGMGAFLLIVSMAEAIKSLQSVKKFSPSKKQARKGLLDFSGELIPPKKKLIKIKKVLRRPTFPQY